MFDLSKPGEDCFDVRKEPLHNVGECKMAAKKLGKNFIREDTWSVFPKGCVFITGLKKVFWNKHETGGKISHIQAICKTGNYIHHYYIYYLNIAILPIYNYLTTLNICFLSRIMPMVCTNRPKRYASVQGW